MERTLASVDMSFITCITIVDGIRDLPAQTQEEFVSEVRHESKGLASTFEYGCSK